MKEVIKITEEDKIAQCAGQRYSSVNRANRKRALRQGHKSADTLDIVSRYSSYTSVRICVF